jgi:hypothetical protein
MKAKFYSFNTVIDNDYYEKIYKFFNQDSKKTLIWLNTVNPQLDNLSPNEMIRLNREEKLYKFIDTSLKDNESLEVYNK